MCWTVGCVWGGEGWDMGLVSLRAKGLVKVGKTLWRADIGPLPVMNQATELFLLGCLEQKRRQRSAVPSGRVGKQGWMKQADATVGVAVCPANPTQSV